MNSNQLPLSGGIAIFFAVIIGYFVIDPSALDGFRPGGDGSQIEQVHGIEDVQARLWQDPFAAAAMHKRSHKSPPKVQLTGEILIPAQGHQRLVSHKMTLGSKNITDTKMEIVRIRHSLKRLIEEIKKETTEKASNGVTILAVMVPAGPYAKPAETRKRMRYAVLSGLGTAKYYPKDAEHIGYVDDLNTSEETENTKNGKQRLKLVGGEEQLPYVMPYEWYEKASGTDEKHVLLLWLDEDAFGKKPLTKLDVLFASLGKHVASIKMIGPYGSTLLKAMVNEAQKEGRFETLKKKVGVYSATATIANVELVEVGNIQSILGGGGGFKTFQRTIATDGELADKLVNEIQLRMKPKEAKNMNYQVAIVSEWDTLYGRALPRAYLKAADDCMNDKKCNKGEQRKFKAGNLYQFTYMRGIDGVLAARDHASQSKGKVKNDETNAQAVVVERPEGRSQKDYLRRLANEISRTDKKLKASGDRGIRAIGVLGSDVYDKLLILRVLRERFPKAVFFTTDLDAALLHPDQFPWTRNMVVVSGYGLRAGLGGGGIQNPPPFRDSYQTAVFYSARNILDEGAKHDSLFIYEIGRSGAVSLGTKNNDNDWILWSRVAAMFLLLVWLAIIFWWRWIRDDSDEKPSSNKEQGFFRCFLKGGVNFFWSMTLFWRQRVVLVADTSLPNNKQGLFRRFLKGLGVFIWWLWVFNFMVSILMIIWVNLFETDPWVYGFALGFSIQWILWLYIYFYLKIWRMQKAWELCSITAFKKKMEKHKDSSLYKRIFYALCDLIFIPYAVLLKPLSYAKEVHLAVLLLAGFLYLVLVVGDGEPRSIFSGVSIWPTEFIRIAAIWLAFFLLWRAWKNMENGRGDIEDKLGVRGAPSTRKADIRLIWDRYNKEGELWERAKRIWLPSVVWVLICLLVYKLQSPNIPFRGDGAYWADVGIGITAIGVFFLLFCFVVDASLHCQKIIKDLIKYNTRWPFMRFSGNGVPKRAQILVLSIKREWKEIRLIAMRTDDISKTVYYPVYVILLLLAAQSDYFDNWDMPYPLMLIATVNVAIVLWAAIMLRRSAVEARDVSLDKIRHIESLALGIADGAVRKRVMRKIRFYKAEIENIREGAFLPISEQPWLRALTLMGGGGGSLLLLQAMAG